MSSERVLLDSSVGGLRDWWWSAYRRSGLGAWRTALHRSHGGEWWQQSATRHWEPTSTDDWKRVMHWRRCMMDCITLESRRGALKDICHPPLKADQWHQLTTRNWTLASRGRVVWRTDDSHWSVLPSTEIKQDPLAKWRAEGGGCGAVDQHCNRLLHSVVTAVWCLLVTESKPMPLAKSTDGGGWDAMNYLSVELRRWTLAPVCYPTPQRHAGHCHLYQ